MISSKNMINDETTKQMNDARTNMKEVQPQRCQMAPHQSLLIGTVTYDIMMK